MIQRRDVRKKMARLTERLGLWNVVGRERRHFPVEFKWSLELKVVQFVQVVQVVQVQEGKTGQGGVAKFLPSSRKPSGHPASGCITPFQILADQIEIKLETDKHLDLKENETKL